MGVLVLAIACAISAQETRFVVPDPVDGIPQAPLLAPDLPDAIQFGDGTYLPRPLDLAVSDLIGYCTERYPGVCGMAISGAVSVCRAECAVSSADAVSAAIDEASGWSSQSVVISALIGIVGGVALTLMVN